ncbi:MAG: 50S ribosomal L9 C-terminal domain-containing protein, partial [Deltaproteobacteria bacterium]
LDDAVVRDQLMQIYSMETTKSLVAIRTRAEMKAGTTPGPGGSLGKLFGSVTSNDVLEGLKAKGVDDVDKKKLVMPEQIIKEVGSYEVGVKLPHGLTAIVKLEVKTRA